MGEIGDPCGVPVRTARAACFKKRSTKVLRISLFRNIKKIGLLERNYQFF